MDSAQILRHTQDMVWHCSKQCEAFFASPESGGIPLARAVSPLRDSSLLEVTKGG